MKILITMAGQGSRFKNVGITKPKHEIAVRGKPMFDWAMESLEAFFDQPFVFVTQEQHSPSRFLEEACTRLGIGDYKIVKLSEYTDGQASTAIEANSLLDWDDSVAIYNIDTYIEPGYLTGDILQGDGLIPTFTAEGERWSFVRTDGSDRVIEVSEKEKISDHATAGFYYFRRWGDFINAYRASADDVKQDYGETYVAPHYNHLIEKGRNVFKHSINREAVHVLGTPKDLLAFDSGFNPNQ